MQSVWVSMFRDKKLEDCEPQMGIYSCTNLLQQMELADSEDEDRSDNQTMSEIECLPQEWLKKNPTNVR